MDKGAARGAVVVGFDGSGANAISAALDGSGSMVVRGDPLPVVLRPAEIKAEESPLTQLNASLLDSMGAAWDLPPQEPIEPREVPVALTTEGEVLLRDRGASVPGPVVLVDSRLSLVLPFWGELDSELVVIVLVRNPLEIVEQAIRRQASSVAFCLHLWSAYYERILLDTTPSRRLVVHYSALAARPRDEMERVAAQFGDGAIPVPKPIIIKEGVGGRLARTYDESDLEMVGVSRNTREMYRKLCQEAHWNDVSDKAGWRRSIYPGPSHSLATPAEIRALNAPFTERVAARSRKFLFKLSGLEYILSVRERNLDVLRRQISAAIERERTLQEPSSPGDPDEDPGEQI